MAIDVFTQESCQAASNSPVGASRNGQRKFRLKAPSPQPCTTVFQPEGVHASLISVCLYRCCVLSYAFRSLSFPIKSSRWIVTSNGAETIARKVHRPAHVPRDQNCVHSHFFQLSPPNSRGTRVCSTRVIQRHICNASCANSLAPPPQARVATKTDVERRRQAPPARLTLVVFSLGGGPTAASSGYEALGSCSLPLLPP